MNQKFSPLKIVKKIYIKLIHILCDAKRGPLIPQLEKNLNALTFRGITLQSNDELSIISSNCFAGRIMQDLHLKYNSPTLGLYFMYPDYIEFLNNLEFYLKKAKLEFKEHSKYPIGDERRASWSHWYPIALLADKVEIHFLHYFSEKEAAEKWYKRAARVNLDRLFIIGMDQNLCTEEDIMQFDKLPYENKLFFSTHNLPVESNEYMPEFEGNDCVGDPYRKAHLFYRHLISYLKNKNNNY
ncbi:MAG: DUF1919 domain-containing protein [Muribaculaceae bacterium]|nr:DUF1919 domain-containing protein [Muribaculaceae bacterium]